MVAYFCHHLSDNYVDLSDLYVVLSQIFMLTCQLFMSNCQTIMSTYQEKIITACRNIKLLSSSNEMLITSKCC